MDGGFYNWFASQRTKEIVTCMTKLIFTIKGEQKVDSKRNLFQSSVARFYDFTLTIKI